ncbi:MAG TPA: eL32 family ribosomal protein [Candidatus Nanoarchaeia archaeon]|nr:eL32 family ribosomal protein [Candidatus Nanoarchaeia archaeon]
MSQARLLKIRSQIKKTKPTFVIKESNYSARVERKWRFPMGRHSGSRQYWRGKPILPTPGYGSPKAVRGLSRSGLQRIVVSNVEQLAKLDPITQGAIISSGVGKKKKLDLLKLASEKKITLLNVKDNTTEITKIEQEYAQRIKLKQDKFKKNVTKKEEKKKRAEEKKKEESKKGSQNSEAESMEDKVMEASKIKEEAEAQKKIAEKTITKKQ